MISVKLNLLEAEIASLLLNKLEKKEITLERAAQISRYVLKSLPDNIADHEIDEILPKLDDHFIELAQVVNKQLKLKEEAENQATIDQATILIHQGSLDKAVNLMTGYIQQKKNG